MTLRGISRTRYHDPDDPEASQDTSIEAQSDMLQPLKQLRRLVWLKNGGGGYLPLPWPKLPANLEELELFPGAHLSVQILVNYSGSGCGSHLRG